MTVSEANVRINRRQRGALALRSFSAARLAVAADRQVATGSLFSTRDVLQLSALTRLWMR
jgi:hypothetical protein